MCRLFRICNRWVHSGSSFCWSFQFLLHETQEQQERYGTQLNEIAGWLLWSSHCITSWLTHDFFLILDELWQVHPEELHFDDPVETIGQGSFGVVLVAVSDTLLTSGSLALHLIPLIVIGHRNIAEQRWRSSVPSGQRRRVGVGVAGVGPAAVLGADQ